MQAHPMMDEVSPNNVLGYGGLSATLLAGHEFIGGFADLDATEPGLFGYLIR